MRITESQLRKVIKKIVSEQVSMDSPIAWEEDQMGRKFYYSPTGTYDWDSTTGHLSYTSNRDGRRQVLSRDLNPRRSGGFHDIKTQEQADQRVRVHMGRQR